jgi:transcription antitermination factor NusG
LKESVIFVEEAALRSNGNRNFGDKNMSIAGMDWYVMRTIPGKEQEAVMLLGKKINHRLWENLRILKKQQLFRTRGKYLLSTKELFPGYIFIETTSPKDLEKELQKARLFPQLIGNGEAELVPIEPEDFLFLENVCGTKLANDMRLSTVSVDREGKVKSAAGALKPYIGRITRQRLRHRYVTAEVQLFNRVENVLFGIRVEGDPG